MIRTRPTSGARASPLKPYERARAQGGPVGGAVESNVGDPRHGATPSPGGGARALSTVGGGRYNAGMMGGRRPGMSSAYGRTGGLYGGGGYGGMSRGYGGSMYGRGMYGGGMYGGGMYGGGMYGRGMYGGGMYGMGMGMGMGAGGVLPPPLLDNASQWLNVMGESVGAFGQLTWMLDNIYRAIFGTVTSVIGMADAFGTMRATVFSILKTLTVVRLVAKLAFWIRRNIFGESLPTAAGQILDANPDVAAFQRVAQQASGGTQSGSTWTMWAVTAAGALYLLSKIVHYIPLPSELEAAEAAEAAALAAPEGAPAVCLYDFVGESEQELSFQKGDAMRVLSTENPDWWSGRRERDGRVGWFPSSFVALEDTGGPVPAAGADMDGTQDAPAASPAPALAPATPATPVPSYGMGVGYPGAMPMGMSPLAGPMSPMYGF